MSKPFILLLSLFCFTVFSQATVFEPEALPPSLNHGSYLPHHPPNIAPAPYYFHHPPHRHHHSPPPSTAYPPRHVTPPAKPPSHVSTPPAHTPSHPPAKPPSLVPVHPPAKPPAYSYPPKQAPVHPPIYPLPRSFVAVQGVVYCKSCRYAGADTFLGALPILGAIVKLQCNSTKHPVVATGKTDEKGYFFIEAPKTITSYGFHKCRVFLVSSPQTKCSKPSNFHDGVVGANLRPGKSYIYNKLQFVLFTVGPFAFEPSCPRG